MIGDRKGAPRGAPRGPERALHTVELVIGVPGDPSPLWGPGHLWYSVVMRFLVVSWSLGRGSGLLRRSFLLLR